MGQKVANFGKNIQIKVLKLILLHSLCDSIIEMLSFITYYTIIVISVKMMGLLLAVHHSGVGLEKKSYGFLEQETIVNCSEHVVVW